MAVPARITPSVAINLVRNMFHPRSIKHPPARRANGAKSVSVSRVCKPRFSAASAQLGIGLRLCSRSRRVVRENEVAILGRQMARKAGLVQRLVARFAVREVRE